SMIYIMVGGFWALLSGSSAKAQSGYGPDWEVEIADAKDEPKQPRVKALISFELQNLMRNNDLSGALDCIRNGAIIMVLTMTVVLIYGAMSSLELLWPNSGWEVFKYGPFSV
ncbi:MAG: hypothetical protein WCK95_28890, partial [Alphaproteobacteria bacterium]